MAKVRYWKRPQYFDQGSTLDGEYPQRTSAGMLVLNQTYDSFVGDATILRTFVDVKLTMNIVEEEVTSVQPWFAGMALHVYGGVYANSELDWPTNAPEDQPQLVITGACQASLWTPAAAGASAVFTLQTTVALESQGQRKSPIPGDPPVVRIAGALYDLYGVLVPSTSLHVDWWLSSFLRVLYEETTA